MAVAMEMDLVLRRLTGDLKVKRRGAVKGMGKV